MSQARIDECRAALASANVLAFLRLIREGESTQTDDAYWWLYGSTKSRTILAETLADHPRKRTYEEYDGQFIKNGKLDYTTAFGAYQITATTWDTNVQPAMHLPDITPASQDLAAVYLLRFRGALADVIDGRIEQAIAKCRNEWVSLPGARVGDQPSQHLRRALQVYLLYGGQIAGAAAAALQDPAPPEPAEAPQATTPPPAPENAPSAAPVEPQVPFRQPTEDDLQSGRAFTQPEQPAMPIPILAVGAKALVSSLAGTLIEAFTPLAREKIQAEIGRHTDRPEIIEQITAGVMTAARAVTGLADPVQAAAEVARSPAALQQVEQSALDTLAQLAPVLEQLAKLDQAQWQRDEDSRAAADARARANPVADQDQYLTQSIVRLMVGVLLGGAILTGVLAYLEVEVQVILGALLALVGAIGGKFSTRYDHRYGSSSGGAAKDAVNLALIQQQRK